MRLWVFSDLHLIFASMHTPIAVPDADVCVVAGDVCVNGPDRSITWLIEHVSPFMPVVFVSGTHAMPRLALGILRIGSVLTQGVTLPFVGMPNPISRSLLLYNEDITYNLVEAKREFDRLIERVDGSLRLEIEVWKLAALLLNPATRPEGRDLGRSLMARSNPDPVAVAWCMRYGLPLKRGRIKKLFGDMLRNGGGDESHVAVLALLSGDKPQRALSILDKFAPQFPDAKAYFAHWREQFGGGDQADDQSLASAFGVALHKADFGPLTMFLMSDASTPEALMSGAEFLASRGAFDIVNMIREKLLGLKTSRAVHIAAGAAMNTDDPQASLTILQDAAAAGLPLTGPFVEMRLHARRALGRPPLSRQPI